MFNLIGITAFLASIYFLAQGNVAEKLSEKLGNITNAFMVGAASVVCEAIALASGELHSIIGSVALIAFPSLFTFMLHKMKYEAKADLEAQTLYYDMQQRQFTAQLADNEDVVWQRMTGEEEKVSVSA